jgi:hypothetical protein
MVAPTLARCVAMDSIIRVVGGLSLWAIEIVMQMRIYALYRCSRKVDIFSSDKLMTLIDVGLGIGSGDQLHTVPNLHRGISLGADTQRRAPSGCNCERDSSSTSWLSLHSQRY